MNAAYLLGALASVFYGSADFYGGAAARHERAPVVALASGIAGLPLMLLLMLLVPGYPTGADLEWSVGAGTSGGIAAALIYRALAIGPVSVASPILALTGMSIPVLAGLALGERPSPLASVGLVLALIAIPLLSVGAHHERDGAPVAPHEDAGATATPGARPAGVLVPSLAAGVAAGGFLLCLGRIGAGSGLGPLVLSRLVSIVMFVGWLLARRMPLWPVPAARSAALGSGVLDSFANTAYLLGVQQGSLSLVAALASLGPATTVLMARGILGERWSFWQRWGLASALAAAICISAG